MQRIINFKISSMSGDIRNNILNFLVIGFIFYGTGVYAQNTINQDVKVIREYNPTVSDALKIEQMPELDDTTSYHPSFKYSILSRAFETANELEPISPAKMAKRKNSLLNNTYTKFGVGTHNTVFGELYYNLLRNEKYTLGLNIAHQSSFGEITLDDKTEVKTPYHDTYAGISFRSIFDKVTLSSGLSFTHNIYEYYGLQTVAPDTQYVNPINSNPYSGDALKIKSTQRISSFKLNFGLHNRETGIENTKWKTNLNYLTFGNKTGAKENRFELSGSLHVPVNNVYFDLDAIISSYSVNFPNSVSPALNFKNKQSTYISVLPRIGLQFYQAYLEGGMLLTGTVGGNQDEIKLAPHITGNLTIAEGIVSIFGGITGEYNFNDYSKIYYENPYISPDLLVNNSFYGINIHGGIKGNFSNTTSFTARVDYNYFNDEHFFINKFYERSAPVDTSIYDYSNLFEVVYDNGSLLKVQGELLIKPDEKTNLRLYAIYNGWNLEDQKYAWNKPETEIGMHGSLKLSETITVNSNLALLGKRYAFIKGSEAKKLDPIFDVNLGVDYHLNKTWTFWGQINNLASMKYYRWNGYPSYGFNLLVGANYSF